MEQYLERLRAQDSGLIRNPDALWQLRRQVAVIVDEVVAATTGEPAWHAGRLADDRSNHRLAVYDADIDTDGALRGVHPLNFVHAATSLYEVALPLIVRRWSLTDAETLVTAGRALHEAILWHLALTSVSYATSALDKLRVSQEEERLRIARELHDRIGHGIGLILQHLDMYRVLLDRDPERARAKLAAATDAVGEAMYATQQLSAELRRSGLSGGIEYALRSYVEAAVPSAIHTKITVCADVLGLPQVLSEEVYLILREAVRNAVRHAGATHIEVSVDVTESELVASVTDDGRGFEPDLVADPHGHGLRSMSERAALLQGVLSISSRVHRGTTVDVRVPLVRSRL
ncbi:sensor histidine kinase [Rhizomonospora bruguierae]|uniref:sensor histidine kinase n=1 Tax=Rhizomonospora bruguierae TaxID=1581705 RepID=UPI001BCF2EA9|nr:sensor histidine kinase [Micromonospora sp. NBRC 107566]